MLLQSFLRTTPRKLFTRLYSISEIATCSNILAKGRCLTCINSTLNLRCLTSTTDTPSSTNGRAINKANSINSNTSQEDFKVKLLDQALVYVPEFGWSRKSISLAAEEVGFDDVDESLFKQDGTDLVMHFVKKSNKQLLDYLEHFKDVRDQPEQSEFIRRAIEFRLRLIIPYVDTWAEAMKLLLSPRLISESTEELSKMVDDIWFYAGDKSTDIEWYTKRAALAQLFGGMQLVMLTDQSADFEETWKFLDRRFEDMNTFKELAESVKEGGESLVTALKNLAMFPTRRH